MNLQKPHIYTVTELTRKVKHLLEDNFPLIWVEGEVSNLRIPASGHIYFDLKDKDSVVHSVFFKPLAAHLLFKLKNGLQIVLYGNLGLYERRGEYQIIAQGMEPKGLGALQLAFEELKRKLEAEGLFAREHKKTIPFLIQHLAIVTSPTGAAIRDIFNIIFRRNPHMEILISPVLVQGKRASSQIVAAIEELNKMGGIDAIILTRGGGSLEDLWPFNEEAVARSIYNSEIPIISAVGHEIDYTISDFVADLRAPTPSAAAELCSIQGEEVLRKIDNLAHQLHYNLGNRIDSLKEKLNVLASSYALKRPTESVRQVMQRIDEIALRIKKTMEYRTALIKEKLKKLSGQLDTLSPLGILGRGYSLTFSYPEGKIIKDSKRAEKGKLIKTKLRKGNLLSKIIEVRYERDEI